MERNSNKVGVGENMVMVIGLFVIVALAFPLQTLAGEFEVDERTVALWHFNQGSGNIIYDSSPNNNDGIIYGAQWVDGKFDKALEFDGVNDYIDIADAPSLDGNWNELTVEVWTRWDGGGLGAFRGAVSKGTAMGIQTYAWVVGTEEAYGMPFASFPGTTSHQPIFGSANSFTLNAWHYIAFTFKEGSAILYFNGENVGERQLDYSTIQDVAHNVEIGRWFFHTANYWSGQLDEVRISNVARTAEEIRAYYQEPVAVANPGLDAEGNLILDGSTSSDIDGNIISFDWILVNRDPAGTDFTLSGEVAATDTVDVGVYDVTLTVTDNDGLTDTDTIVLYVPQRIPDWLLDGLDEIEALIGLPPGLRASTSDYPDGDPGDQLDRIIDMLLSPPGQARSHGSRP